MLWWMEREKRKTHLNLRLTFELTLGKEFDNRCCPFGPNTHTQADNRWNTGRPCQSACAQARRTATKAHLAPKIGQKDKLHMATTNKNLPFLSGGRLNHFRRLVFSQIHKSCAKRGFLLVFRNFTPEVTKLLFGWPKALLWMSKCVDLIDWNYFDRLQIKKLFRWWASAVDFCRKCWPVVGDGWSRWVLGCVEEIDGPKPINLARQRWNVSAEIFFLIKENKNSPMTVGKKISYRPGMRWIDASITFLTPVWHRLCLFGAIVVEMILSLPIMHRQTRFGAPARYFFHPRFTNLPTSHWSSK